MQNLPMPLSELVVDYFDKRAPFDYMTMDFATSLARDGCVDACTFLVAMVYMDRVRAADKTYFEASSPNDIYLSALVVASKFLYDGGLEEFVYNDEWAASASTSLNRVNTLELELLDILSWNINVEEKEFDRILNEAEQWIAKNALSKRGFCTYNEARVLSSRIDFMEKVFLPFISILSSLFVVYAAVLISLLVIPRISLRQISANESRLAQTSEGCVTELIPDFEMPSVREDVFKQVKTAAARVFGKEDSCVSDHGFCNFLLSHNFTDKGLRIELANKFVLFAPICAFS